MCQEILGRPRLPEVIEEAVVVSSAADAPREATAERLGGLFDAHHRRLYAVARRMTGSRDAARDLVYETFVSGARWAASIPDGFAHEQAWLVRVLVNTCRGDWRKQVVRRRTAATNQPSIHVRMNPHASQNPRSGVPCTRFQREDGQLSCCTKSEPVVPF